MVILHFLSLIEGLQEFNSLVLAKVRHFFDLNWLYLFELISLLSVLVFSNVDSSALHVTVTRRSIKASETMSKLSIADWVTTQHVGQLRCSNKVFTTTSIQNSHDWNTIIDRCYASKQLVLALLFNNIFIFETIDLKFIILFFSMNYSKLFLFLLGPFPCMSFFFQFLIWVFFFCYYTFIMI